MIKIPKKIIEEIAGHARDEAPLEACGYLAGKENEVLELYRMRNIDQSSEHFSFAPKEQFGVVKKVRVMGLELIAVYHSHPATSARLSSEDIRLALDPKTIYVIHSLLNNETKAFKVIEGKIINETIL
ncbi:hypothetical protein COT42_08045 [Candidatus Saganbacteria bacterium CG08_land_8_20_14_0_20_45_16]|uniref:MPN domain-containing protein n=1 Tax=Candidatus Saganbacteria bacterium CG08_land_8_20_14_0_20_45_16 TaxID=2014293 RepID=A0A2H0XWD5_UNCSA|nr:MAG: hypothetical protein COT42_08045 [Candidatus Saganbacteria bacterium CG08_land_8_20_14_0_20_45_16]